MPDRPARVHGVVYEPVPLAAAPWLVIAALLPFVALGAWLGAIAAAWKHRREPMALLIGVALLASAGTLGISMAVS